MLVSQSTTDSFMMGREMNACVIDDTSRTHGLKKMGRTIISHHRHGTNTRRLAKQSGGFDEIAGRDQVLCGGRHGYSINFPNVRFKIASTSPVAEAGML